MHTQGRYSGVARTNASTCRVRARTIRSAHSAQLAKCIFKQTNVFFREITSIHRENV